MYAATQPGMSMTEITADLHASVRQALQLLSIDCKVMSCDPELADTATFCQHYHFSADQTCNAIIAASKTEPIQYACALILATCKLDVNKKICQLLGVKKCSFASGEQTLALTGMLIGG